MEDIIIWHRSDDRPNSQIALLPGVFYVVVAENLIMQPEPVFVNV
jgi:hypothetical protein